MTIELPTPEQMVPLSGVQYTIVTDLNWVDEAHTAINCRVQFGHISELVPFTARNDDPEAHGREILARAIAGDFGDIAPYAAPAPIVPQVISDRQFFQQLSIAGIITNDEALAAVKTGAIPAVMQSFVDQLTGADKFSAEMLLSGAVEFRRDHPLTEAIGASQGWTSEMIDGFFIAAAVL